MSKYETQIIALGDLTQEFIDGGILVFFGPDAPDELAEFSIIHAHGELASTVCAGDRLIIGEDSWPILAVGEVANQNLQALGHFVVKFNGATTAELPGDISLPSGQPPLITPGMRVQFLAGGESRTES